MVDDFISSLANSTPEEYDSLFCDSIDTLMWGPNFFERSAKSIAESIQRYASEPFALDTIVPESELIDNPLDLTFPDKIVPESELVGDPPDLMVLDTEVSETHYRPSFFRKRDRGVETRCWWDTLDPTLTIMMDILCPNIPWESAEFTTPVKHTILGLLMQELSNQVSVTIF
ncbi:hypothetical protein OROMI_003911 [Orobanche minor]